MRLTPLGFCLRVIVNEKPLNLEKTTSSVLSVLLLIKCGFLLRLETLHKFTLKIDEHRRRKILDLKLICKNANQILAGRKKKEYAENNQLKS